MVTVENLINKFEKNKINFYCGVPDSVLSKIILYLDKHKSKKHLICANEGGAIGVAIGNYLSSNKITCVYMQNSGLGNAVNPIISIAHSKIYSIPMILLIGWRGAPKIKDEPQHLKQGAVTKDLLKLLNIKSIEIKQDKDLTKISPFIRYAKKNKKIIAILIKKKSLKLLNDIKQKKEKKNKIDRSVFIKELIYQTKKNYKIISNTGYISRDLYRLRDQKIDNQDFYMIGGMGHAQMVSYGAANFSRKKIICLDGDGSLLMHLGSSAIFGNYPKKNLKYVLLNNGSHESVGGQKCISEKINFKNLSSSLGFKKYLLINKYSEMKKKMKIFLNSKSNIFLEVKLNKRGFDKLPRIKNLERIKINFMKKK
jgi:phosphonopyruvate decarboxylase